MAFEIVRRFRSSMATRRRPQDPRRGTSFRFAISSTSAKRLRTALCRRTLRLEAATIGEAAKRLELASLEQVAEFLHDLVPVHDAGRGWFGREQIYQWVSTVHSRYINCYTPAALHSSGACSEYGRKMAL